MDGETPLGGRRPDSPDEILDALREFASEDEDGQGRQLARLVERFPVDQLRDAVQARLRDLGGGDGEAILRLVEAYATPGLLDQFARALIDQPDLPADRAWEALAVVEGAGLIEDYPELLERWDELNDSIEDEGDAIGALVAQLEEEPEGSWVALQGFGAIEPEVRREILAGMADFRTGPGLVAFLRLLCFAHDPTTRQSALEALAARSDDDEEHQWAWAEIAHDHHDPQVVDRAHARLGSEADQVIARAVKRSSRACPQPLGNLVTALNGSGRGTIVLASRDRGKWVAASFLCDVWKGVVDVFGQVGDDSSIASSLFEDSEVEYGPNLIEDVPELAFGLLSGSLLLCPPSTNPVLRYWIERTSGPDFRPRPFSGLLDDSELASNALELMAEASWLILDACSDWVDTSDLTYDLAEEIALRSGELAPDPRRDSGAYRYLFEHRLIGRLEHYRRMLLWMASYWHASGDEALGRSALTLSWQLSDPQHAVPAHPFTVALTTKSLAMAQYNIKAGLDPRKQQGGRPPGWGRPP